MYVMVDTSVWSIFLRRNHQGNKEIYDKLKELIEENRVKIIGPIKQEILSGIKEPKIFNALKLHLEGFEDVIIDQSDYFRAAEMYNICSSKGVQGSHIDFLICAVSEKNHLSIFTLDKDFSHFAKHLPLLLVNNLMY